MNTPRLQAPGVLLRPLSLEDAPALFVAMSDPEVQRYRSQPPHSEPAETARYIEETLRKGYGWAITTDGREALGRIALRVDGDTGECGVVLRGAAQGRGLGTQAVRLVGEFAFATLELKHMRAEIDSRNEPSLRLFKSLGFVRTSFAPAAYETHIGARDSVVVTKDAHHG